jgi:hypothetical protein
MAEYLPTRLVQTRRNMNNYEVVRLGGILAQPTEFRQTLHSASIPAIAYWGIQVHGLRISTAGVSPQWGDGAYVWPARIDITSQPWVDIEAPTGTLIEELRVKGQNPFYRLLPLAGDHIRVRMLGTNIPGEILEQFRAFAQ